MLLSVRKLCIFFNLAKNYLNRILKRSFCVWFSILLRRTVLWWMNDYSEGFEGKNIENKIIFKSNVIISLLKLDNKKKNMQKLKRFGFIFVRIEGFLIVLFGVIGRGENNFYEILRKIMFNQFNVFLHSKTSCRHRISKLY